MAEQADRPHGGQEHNAEHRVLAIRGERGNEQGDRTGTDHHGKAGSKTDEPSLRCLEDAGCGPRTRLLVLLRRLELGLELLAAHGLVVIGISARLLGVVLDKEEDDNGRDRNDSGHSPEETGDAKGASGKPQDDGVERRRGDSHAHGGDTHEGTLGTREPRGSKESYADGGVGDHREVEDHNARGKDLERVGARQHGKTDSRPGKADDRNHLGADLAAERAEEHDSDQADPAGDGDDIGHVGLLPAVHLVKEAEQRVGGRVPE